MLLYTGSNGSTTFSNIAPGKYRLRVVASAPGYITGQFSEGGW